MFSETQRRATPWERLLAIGFLLFSSLALISPAPARAQDQSETIRRLFSKSTLFLTVRVKTADGFDCESGTGFFISSDGYVLTAWHLLTDKTGQPYTNPSIRGKIANSFDCKDPIGDIKELEFIRADRDQDIALLKVKGEGGPYDFVRACRETAVTTGANLYILGFPLGQPLHSSRARLGNPNAARGFWQLDGSVNPGNSGGPAFNENGRLVGVVHGGIEGAQDISYIIPVNHAYDLFNTAQVPMEYCKTAAGNVAASEPQQSCEPIFHAYPVRLVKNDHSTASSDSRLFTVDYPSEPNYKIKSFEWKALSSNNASEIDISLSDDRRRISASVRLTSGPFFDRWRGWISGWISTVQLPKDCL